MEFTDMFGVFSFLLIVGAIEVDDDWQRADSLRRTLKLTELYSGDGYAQACVRRA
jgi:hypothetical protein